MFIAVIPDDSLVCAIFSDQDEAVCSEMLIRIAHHFSDIDMQVMPRRNDRLITRAKDMIHASLNDVLKLDELSRELGMTKYQFIRAFKASTGISPYRFFLNSKLEHAKRIIEQKKDIYSAVADCGFVDLSHLNRHFKRVYGITAMEYLSYIE